MDHSRSLAALLAWAVLALVPGCRRTPTVGYDGPLPSVEAREVCLRPLDGRRFQLSSGPLAGGELLYVGFLVAGEPLVDLDHFPAGGAASVRVSVPVVTDGDAADLHERVTGERVREFEGPLSDAYRAALGL